jgi:thiol-disulfide isomerase/thioredoxin/outer membrane lipoprotein-sorting protein
MPRFSSVNNLNQTTIRVLTLLILICLSTTAWANAEYEKASAKSAQLAEELQSYQLSGVITMSNQSEGETGANVLEATMVAAARWPDLMMNSQGGDMAAINLGTSQSQSWFYFGMMEAAYVGRPITLNRDLANAGIMELSEKNIYNFFNGIAQFLLADDLEVGPETGHEVLAVNGGEVPCLVFTAEGSGVANGKGQPVDGPQKIFYDPKSGLVLKNEQTLYLENKGVQIERIVTFILSDFALNEGVEEEKFAYTPPAEVRVVNELDRLTNPDSMTGEQAPDITFTDFDGETFQLSEMRGKPVFIDFWATWCGPCKMEMPHIESLYHELGVSGKIQIIAASSEDRHSLQNFLARNPYSFQVVTVAGEDVHKRFKTTSIPTGFVIDAEGVIRAHMVGAQSEAQLREAFAKVGVK